MSVRIQLRRDTAANWASTNPTLTQGEPGYETDTGKIKYGDGSTAWNSLEYAPSAAIVDGTIVNADVNASAAIAGTKISPDFGAQNVTTTGTSTAASFTPTSSTVPTNGVYLPAANSVALSTNGTGRLFIDSSGRVGIGTSSPSYLLHVESTTAYAKIRSLGNFAQLYIQSSDTTRSIINFGSTSNEGRGAIDYDNPNDKFTFKTNGLSRLVIDSSGRVGIGDGPDSTLTVKAATGVTPLRISGPSSEFARVTSDGKLLVGTSSARSNFFNVSSVAPGFQLEGTGIEGRNASIVSSSSTGSSTASLILAHQKSGTVGGNTRLDSGDIAGRLSFQGSDGNEFVEAAFIQAEIDGTPGANDMPGRLVFSTTADGASSPTERMRIRNNGDVLINTTSSGESFFDGTIRVEDSTTVSAFRCTGTAGALVQSLWHQATTGDNQFVSFGTEVTRSTRGSITYNRAGGVVAYNTTSDYRAKTILGTIDNPGATIDAFKVYRGVINGATVERPMLIAHEAQEIAPYCVTGEKDAVDDDGNPIYQQMDHQVLIPLLIAELQQLRSRVAALEAS